MVAYIMDRDRVPGGNGPGGNGRDGVAVGPSALPRRMAARISKLPLRTIVGFALPGAGYGAIDVIFVTFTLKFATDVLLVPPALMGTVYAAGRFWDALSDPIVGYLCDITTSSGIGRRRLWMLCAAAPFGGAFAAVFSPPASLSPPALTAWLAACIFCYYTAHTAFTVPHLSLGVELSETVSYADRTRLFGARSFCAFGIGALSGVGCLSLLFAGEDADTMRTNAAVVCACVGLATANLIAIAVGLLHEAPGRAGLSPRRNPLSLGSVVLSTRHARLYTAVATLHEGSRAAFGTLAPYAIQYGLALSPKWVAPLMAAYLIAHVIGYVCKATHTNAPACVLPHARAARLSDTTVRHILSRGSIPMWVALARRYGKVPAFLASIRLYVVLNLLFVPAAHPRFNEWLSDEQRVVYAVGSGFLHGLASSAKPPLGDSIAGDVIDHEQSLSGERKRAHTVPPHLCALSSHCRVCARLRVVCRRGQTRHLLRLLEPLQQDGRRNRHAHRRRRARGDRLRAQCARAIVRDTHHHLWLLCGLADGWPRARQPLHGEIRARRAGARARDGRDRTARSGRRWEAP